MEFKEFVKAGYKVNSDIRVINTHALMLDNMQDIHDTVGHESFIDQTYDDYISYSVLDSNEEIIKDEISSIDDLEEFIQEL